MDKKNHKYPSKDQKKHTHREAIHGHKKRIHWLNAVREEEAEEEIQNESHSRRKQDNL